MRWKISTSRQGEPFDLSHLDNFSFYLIIPVKDEKPEQTYRLNVIFSLHCFTRKAKSGEDITTSITYSDERETRIFDKDRYELSFQLPDIIKSLPTKKCYHDKHGNFYVFEIIDNNSAVRYYSVFFTVSKSGRKKGLNLYISSAYARNNRPYERNPKSVKFSVIIYNIWKNKKLKPA